MAGDDEIALHVEQLPAPPLRAAVASYVGYEYRGLAPGVHVGTPGASLTLVISLDAPVDIAEMPDLAQRPAAIGAFVGGLSAAPALIRHEGIQHGVQLELTPEGSRALLGMPAAAIGPAVVPLEDVLGREGRELPARLAEAPTWSARFALLDALLGRRLSPAPATPPSLTAAWHLLLASGGTLPIAELARRTGWSRRHLSLLFMREYGLSPKTLARIVRFDRSRRLLATRGASLARVAAAAGYSDQAHLTREWRDLARTTPAAWLRDEQLPIVQDDDAAAAGGLAA